MGQIFSDDATKKARQVSTSVMMRKNDPCFIQIKLLHILNRLFANNNVQLNSVLVTACLSLFRNETLFSPSKYIGYKCYICFRPGMGQFFSSSHLSTLVALFLLYSQKIFVPYIVLVTACHSLFRNETLFSPSKYI